MSDSVVAPNVYLTKIINGETLYTQTAINFMNENISISNKEISQLREAIKVLQEANEFCGNDPDTEGEFEQMDWDLVNNSSAIQDRGKRARAAKAEVEKILNER